MIKIFSALMISIIFLGGCSINYNPVKNTDLASNDSLSDSTLVADSDKINQTPTTEILNLGESLDLSNQKLENIPASVFEKTNLEELNVSGNYLTGSIPGEIRFLKDLKILKVSNNQMTGVPAEIGQLQNLEILDLSNNQLTGLPYELGNLRNLKVFNISGNNYSDLDLAIIEQELPETVNIIK